MYYCAACNSEWSEDVILKFQERKSLQNKIAALEKELAVMTAERDRLLKHIQDWAKQ